MKKSLLLLSLLALLASCADDGLLPQPSDTIKSVTITASDIILDEPATRTDLSVGKSGLQFAWAANDTVGIFPNTGDQLSFPMTAGAGTQSANFDGGGWAVKASSDYAAYFPFSMGNYGKSRTALPFSYTGQQQDGDNITAHLGAYDLMVASASSPSNGNIGFQFNHLNSFLWIQLQHDGKIIPSYIPTERLTLSADEEVFTEEATVDISTGIITPTKKSKSLTLDVIDHRINKDDPILNYWMVVCPVDLTGKTLTATLYMDGLVLKSEIAGKNFETGKAYILTGNVELYDFIYDKYDPTTDDLGFEYVDLELPSGTLWATRNVGAATVFDAGDCFAWGETEAKSRYDWDSYQLCVDASTNLTKYCHSSSYGLVDNKYALDKADDVVCTDWGGNWRMPTKAELDELLTYCQWTWQDNFYYKGASGYTVKGTNGMSIFLPAAGISELSQHYYSGQRGYYWTRSQNTSGWSDKAIGLYFDDSTHEAQELARSSGCYVRPVYAASPLHDYVDLGLSVKWADCNIGAENPEDCGYTFSWGETEPFEEKYDQSYYKWANNTFTFFRKYNTDSQYGTVDGRAILDLSDDAAHVLWGGNWRMPTQAEMEELVNNCTWMWTRRSGVNGYYVKGNGTSIFLPAGDDEDEHGYWSSTLDATDPPYAYGLYFTNDVYLVAKNFRDSSLRVRPVCAE